MSDTISFGLVFRPEIGDLSVAIDYFNIEIEDTISSTVGGNADTYINSCLDTGDPAFCDLVQRDSLGSLWLTPGGFIVDTSLNLGTLTTEGVDLQASYTLNFGEHRLGFNLVGTYLMDLSNAPLPNGESYDCTGFYGNTCGVPAAEWRHSFRANWRTPWNGLDVAATWRHFGDVTTERLSTNPQLSGGVNVNGIGVDIPSYNYLDLTASMTFAEKYTVTLDGQNLNNPTLKYFALNEDQPRAFYQNGAQYYLSFRVNF